VSGLAHLTRSCLVVPSLRTTVTVRGRSGVTPTGVRTDGSTVPTGYAWRPCPATAPCPDRDPVAVSKTVVVAGSSPSAVAVMTIGPGSSSDRMIANALPLKAERCGAW